MSTATLTIQPSGSASITLDGTTSTFSAAGIQAAQAVGQVIHVEGRVTDTRGQPKPGSVVEIWQCDARGVYRHPRAAGQ